MWLGNFKDGISWKAGSPGQASEVGSLGQAEVQGHPTSVAGEARLSPYFKVTII